jgi:hypothetical protein
VSKAGVSGVIDLLGNGKGVVQDADGNSNLMSPRTVIPLLLSEVEGEMWLASRVFAVPADERGEVREWVEGWKDVEGRSYHDAKEVLREAGVDV